MADQLNWQQPKFLDLEIVQTYEHEIRLVTSNGRLIGGRVDNGIFEVNPQTGEKTMLFTHDRAMTWPLLLTRSGHLIAGYLQGNNTKFMRSKDNTFTSFDKDLHDIGAVSTLDHSMVENEEGVILFADYIVELGETAGLLACRIRRSKDDGKTWQIVNEIPNEQSGHPDHIRHIHCVEYDPYEKMFWISCGDKGKQPRMYKTKDGTTLELVGKSNADTDFWNTGQMWRSVSIVFREDCVLWGMDGGYPGAWVVRYDRKTGETKNLFLLTDYNFYARTIDLSWGNKKQIHVFSPDGGDLFLTEDGYNGYQPLRLVSESYHYWFGGPSRWLPTTDEFWISNRADILAPDYSDKKFRSAKIKVKKLF